MVKRSRRYRELAAKLEGDQPLELTKAVEILKQFASTKFNQSVEVAMHLGVDPRQQDQIIRGAINLPHGTGNVVRLAVFAKGDNIDKAKEAGADYVGGDDLAQKIKEGWLDFDMTIATPDMMGLVGPLGKILGPKGLMPTPKNGTVTPDVATAVREFKGGKIDFRVDAGANLHALVGKLNFTTQQLEENIRTFVEYIRNNRPSSVKGTFVQSVTISATMSPGIPVLV